MTWSYHGKNADATMNADDFPTKGVGYDAVTRPFYFSDDQPGLFEADDS